jgi:glycosyltransferase A (GT-A) superfamily protein (DUF2064 family)
MEIMVMAKAPVPGRVKTRLCPPCTPEQAADLAAAALADTLAAAEATGYPVVVALEGDPACLRGRRVRIVAQRGDTFGERLANAWQHLGGGGVQIGMDTPQVTPRLLRRAVAAVRAHGAALGMAVDGGWWALGLRRPLDDVFTGVPMSSPITGVAQRGRLIALGADPAILPVVRDVDTWADAALVASCAPRTGFATAVRAVAPTLDRVR